MKFLVVGEAMLDRYYCGRITRLNPEKHSAPLLSCSRVVERPGGAANVAANLLSMGAQIEFLHQSRGCLHKNRLLDDDGGVIARFDQEDECFPVDVSEIQEKAKNCCAIIVSNYGKGAISNETVLAIEKLDLPTFVDTKVRPDLWASWVEAMFPNEREYALHRSDYREVRTCVVKRGVSGASLLVDGLRVEDVAATCNSPRNVSGAGDTVLASYVAAHMAIVLSHRQDIHRVFPLQFAMMFAGTAVKDPFTTAPSFLDVYKGLESFPSNVRSVMEELRR